MGLRRRDAVRIMYGTGAGVHTAIVKGGQVTPPRRAAAARPG